MLHFRNEKLSLLHNTTKNEAAHLILVLISLCSYLGLRRACINVQTHLRPLLLIYTYVWIIRIYHECEDGIEKSVPRFTVWHHLACRVMTNSDRDGQIFLSYPHTNNGFFFLQTIKQCIFIFKKCSQKS